MCTKFIKCIVVVGMGLMGAGVVVMGAGCPFGFGGGDSGGEMVGQSFSSFIKPDFVQVDSLFVVKRVVDLSKGEELLEMLDTPGAVIDDAAGENGHAAFFMHPGRAQVVPVSEAVRLVLVEYFTLALEKGLVEERAEGAVNSLVNGGETLSDAQWHVLLQRLIYTH